MLDIYICEDNDNFRSYLVKTIKSDITFTDKDMQIVYDTANPYDLLDKLKNNQKTNIYFLDIDLNSNMDGIELGEMIRRTDPVGYISFITADGESYKKTFEYKLQALGYIEKNNPNDIVSSISNLLDYIDKLAAKQNTPQKNTYTIFTAGKTVHVNKDDIVAIEIKDSNARKLQLYTEYASYSYRGILKDVLNELNKDNYNYFARPHQSYILNLKCVEKLNFNRTIGMKGGAEYLSSRRYWGDFKKMFTNMRKRNEC